MGAKRLRERRPGTALEQTYEGRRRDYARKVEAVKGVRLDEVGNMGFCLDAVMGKLAVLEAAILAIDPDAVTAHEEFDGLKTAFAATKASFPKP